MASMILRVVAANDEIRELSLDRQLVIEAEPGAHYSVIDSETYSMVEDLELKRDGEVLQIEVDGEVVATIDNFYGSGEVTSFQSPTSTPLSYEAHGSEETGDVDFARSSTESSAVDGSWEHTASVVKPVAGTGAGKTAALVAGGAVVVGGTVVSLNDENSDTDVTPPAAPTIDPIGGDDVIDATETEGITVTGTAEALSTVELTLGTGNVRSVTVDSEGGWSYTLVGADLAAMGQGDVTVSALARDGAGNASTPATRDILIDTIVPTAPVIGTVASNDIIGASEVGSAITGTAEASATVSLSLGGNVRTISADPSGSWSYTLTGADITAMGEGPETLSATATDGVGNVGTAGTRAITIDTVTPSAPAIDVVATDDIITFPEKSSAISGTSEAGATINLSLGGVVRTITADGSGNWSYNLVEADFIAMGQGTEILSATATDSADQTGPAGTRIITVDSVDPSVVVFDLVSGVSSSHSTTTFDAGTSYDIYIRVDSNSVQLNTANEGGTGGTWNTWSGGSNLGSDDIITLVGSGGTVIGPWSVSVTTNFATTTGTGTSIMVWGTSSAGPNTPSAPAALLWSSGVFTRNATFTTITTTSTIFSIVTNTHVITTFGSSSVNLWSGFASLSTTSLSITSGHLTTMPAGILTSQGLV